MSDFQERLVAADPVAGRPYSHHDPEAMFSRIVTHHPLQKKDGVLRTFKLKMMGAMTVASLVTVGGIAVLQSAVPALPVLAFASDNFQKAASASSAQGFSTTMRINEEFIFTGGADLAQTTPSANAYRLLVPSSPSAELDRINSIFSVTSSSSPFVSVTYENSGVPQWTYSNSSAATAPTSSFTSTSSIEAAAQKYIQELGYGYTATDPQLTSSNNQEDISYSVVVDGVLTDQHVQFTFEANNVLTYASGPAFSIGSTVNYPLQSPLAGVGALNEQQRISVTPSSQSSSNPDTIPSTTSPSLNSATSVGPVIIHVMLNSVTTELKAVTLTNRTVWLVPNYVYSGTIKNAGKSTSMGSWSTIALDPAYVTLPVKKAPITY